MRGNFILLYLAYKQKIYIIHYIEKGERNRQKESTEGERKREILCYEREMLQCWASSSKYSPCCQPPSGLTVDRMMVIDLLIEGWHMSVPREDFIVVICYTIPRVGKHFSARVPRTKWGGTGVTEMALKCQNMWKMFPSSGSIPGIFLPFFLRFRHCRPVYQGELCLNLGKGRFLVLKTRSWWILRTEFFLLNGPWFRFASIILQHGRSKSITHTYMVCMPFFVNWFPTFSLFLAMPMYLW